jgi:endonuclease YncB( thermonuclease family)
MNARRFSGLARARSRRGRPPFARRLAEFMLAMLMLGALALGFQQWSGETVSARENEVRVIDGDSLSLNGRMVRLWGIDAPELQQGCTRGSETYACGRAARERLRALARNGAVTCDGIGTDQYDRLLAVCHTGAVDVNATLVREGFAFDFGGYSPEEVEARAARRGVWAGDNERPRAYRDRMKGQMEGEAGALDRLYHAVSRWLRNVRGETT